MPSPSQLRRVLPRAQVDVREAMAAVTPLVEAVAERGYSAARAATLRFDGVDVARAPRSRQRHSARRSAKLDRVDPSRAGRIDPPGPARCTRRSAARRSDVDVVAGGTVTQTWVPVERVGLYVPGGLAVYPSSVVMNVVPAQVAGVASIAVCSPPQREFGGWPHPAILAACALLGVDEVYAVGGAQAMAMLAYGDADLGIEPVDLITGPGNVYVAAAKRLVRGSRRHRRRGRPDRDRGPRRRRRRPGPRRRRPDQPGRARRARRVRARHRLACALADAVDAELERQVALTKHVERVRAALTGEQSATVLVDDIEQGLAVVDAWAAEHLEIITADARALAERVRNAGCVFVGPYSPVSLGDYCAGSNHVLPTGGTARHASGPVGADVPQGHAAGRVRRGRARRRRRRTSCALGGAEDLPAHGAAVAASPARRGPVTDARPTCRCAMSCAASSPTARRSSTSRSGSTPTRTPTRRRRLWSPTSRRRSRRSRGELNRYPDRDAIELRADLADYLNGDGATG